ncbi:MAG: UDP-N-acetylmuramoyl-L-alanyl-D-glutamate--2,6-diaminopimelate ligase, partial [Alphaproteobacteria bacterium]|nr:UDP-N-acetylmuramoyl-L-alanyl-D-glutamate--2,6-diaminopimelate ligase [Alphaproteobacteria bacterium]
MMMLSTLLAAAGIDYKDADLEITNISCNSADIKSGGLFFAVKGVKTNGADFVPNAVQNGAVAVICEQRIEAAVPVIIVSDIRVVMAKIADAFYPSESVEKVAVTGTNGKTSSVYYVAQILNALG